MLPLDDDEALDQLVEAAREEGRQEEREKDVSNRYDE
jgi:hypothetical protein